MRGHNTAPEVIEKIRQEWSEGWQVWRIGKAHGVSKDAVYRYCEGLDRKGPLPPLTDTERSMYMQRWLR